MNAYEEQETEDVFEPSDHGKGFEPGEGLCGTGEACVGGQGL